MAFRFQEDELDNDRRYKMVQGIAVVDPIDADMRSDDGDGACGPCPQFSWATSQHGTLPRLEVNRLLSSQLDIKPPAPPGAAAVPGADEFTELQWVPGDSMEDNLTRFWTVIQDEITNHREVLSYEITAPARTKTKDVPLFLGAVCLILRAHLLCQDICVVLQPRWMGVPGTQWGLRCQLRQLMARCEQVSPADICRSYREHVGPPMTPGPRN